MMYGPDNFYETRRVHQLHRNLKRYQQPVEKLPTTCPHSVHNATILTLSELHSSYDGPPLNSIIQAVRLVTGIRLVDFVSPRRQPQFCDARAVYYHLARTLTPRSFPEIGRRCGNRDHSTVVHGFNKVAADPAKYADTISAAKRVLGIAP